VLVLAAHGDDDWAEPNYEAEHNPDLQQGSRVHISSVCPADGGGTIEYPTSSTLPSVAPVADISIPPSRTQDSSLDTAATGDSRPSAAGLQVTKVMLGGASVS
jgi:hypothetical protein